MQQRGLIEALTADHHFERAGFVLGSYAMSQLTIQISESAFRSLQERAKQLGTTPEAVAAECVARIVGPEEDDPLLKWAGAFDSGPSDASDRHDYYIGQALAKEMRGVADE